MTTSSWPYPSYAEPQWLGGEDGEDRTLGAVIRITRATVAAAGDAGGTDTDSVLATLSHLADIAERVDWAMLSLVGEARALGVPWVTIGASLGVTKQAAQQRFASYVKQALEQAEEQLEPDAQSGVAAE